MGIAYNQLCKVVELVWTTNTCKDSTVLALENLVQLISAYISHFFAKCYEYHLQIQTLMITNRMPILWISFYLSDLWCPIILWLTGIRLPVFDNTASAFKIATTIMNPVAITTFFNKTCTVIFDHLLAVEFIESGLFGLMSTYFKIVETNRRDILHLYYLVWLIGMTNLFNFWQRICGNPYYLGQLLDFLDHIITANLPIHSSDLFFA